MPRQRPTERRRSPRRRRQVMVARAVAALVLVAALLGVAAAVQLLRGVPAAQASVVVPGRMTIGGGPPSMPWPAKAAASVDIEGVADLGGARQDVVRPLASVTKLLTALVVLGDHPLGPGQGGPLITVSAAEAAAYPKDVAEDQSLVKVEAGERIDERQALEALLVPSADNMADILARWCAGGAPAFVKALNAKAAALGLTRTHLADASGFNSSSVGTARDMVRLGEAVMGQPVLRSIVDMPKVTLPVAGTVDNYDTVLGQDGIIGIKTGSDSQAGGNFVFAARRTLDGRPVTVVGAVLGGSGADPLESALDDAKALASAAFDQVEMVRVVPAGQRVLQVRTKWGASDTAVTGRPATLLAVPGQALTVQVVRSRALKGWKLSSVHAGQQLATLVLSTGGQVARVPVVATSTLAPAPASYRLFRF